MLRICVTYRKIVWYFVCLGLHSRHVYGLAGANILISNTGVVKLADFGCSKTLNGISTPTGSAMDASFRRIKGTIPFMAPEGTTADMYDMVYGICINCL